MRDRPYLSASEQPRPYSEILMERRQSSVVERVLREVAELEQLAAEQTCPAERNRLLCEAEGLRCALAHRPGAVR